MLWQLLFAAWSALAAAEMAPQGTDAPGAGKCDAVLSVRMRVHVPPVANAVLYEFQYQPAVQGSAFDSYHMSRTSAQAEAEITDLEPSTTYALRARATAVSEVDGWGGWSEVFTCTTEPVSADAPRRLRELSRNSTGITVAWDRPAVTSATDHPTYVVQVLNTGGKWQPFAVTTSEHVYLPNAKFGEAAPVTLRVQEEGGGSSDPVEFIVGRSRSRFLPLVRASERQNATTTVVDFLTNHNAGDIESDSLFLTGIHGSHFIRNFSANTIAQYCVEVSLSPFADYVSCNALDNQSVFNATQTCVCNNEIDRRIGHRSVTPACPPDSTGRALCKCSRASASASARYVGMMPTYLPWMCGSWGDGNGTCAINTPFGRWYSLPGEGQCAEGEPLGSKGCTWRRMPVAKVLRGAELIRQGWNSSDAGLSKDGANDRIFCEAPPFVLAQSVGCRELVCPYEPSLFAPQITTPG